MKYHANQLHSFFEPFRKLTLKVELNKYIRLQWLAS